MRTALCIIIGLTIVAPAASAAPGSPIQGIIAQEDAARMTLLRGKALAAAHTAPAAVVVTVTAGRFDWGDAGIGGAAAVALTVLAAGGVVLVRDARRQKAHG